MTMTGSTAQRRLPRTRCRPVPSATTARRGRGASERPDAERRGRQWSWISPFIPKHETALHHELHALHFSHVHEGVAGDGDDIGELSPFNAADLLFPVVVQQ